MRIINNAYDIEGEPMRNAKKLVLLLLSLALLCGIFAVIALAEEAPQVATVVYPDGSTETVAVGDTIVGKEFVTEGDAKLYYGAGNTLFKDDATEGWIFTVEGADTALADLTVTEDMAGKKIIASGADKVYYVTVEALESVTNTVYHLVNDVDKLMSSSNTGDRGDGTNTGASSRDVLGNKTTKSVSITLYEDVITSQFNMILMPTTRQNTGIPTYLDLNGHNVTNNYSGSYTEVKGAKLYIYSSVPGANWYQPNSTHAFYAGDDGTPYLGNNSANTAEFSDNIRFFAKSFFAGHWGGGAYIFGGHFYQLPGTTLGGTVSIARRVNEVRDASFYVLPGYSVFSDESTPQYYNVGNGTGVVSNCKFYGTDDSAVLVSTQSAKLKFENCTFYGITGALSGAGTGSVTATSTEEGGTNTFADPISYKTVTWYDGTTDLYYAATLDDAKAFVESQAKAKPATYELKEGKELSLIYDPTITVTYDENLNATVTRTGGTAVKVYYTITYADGSVEYYTNAADYQAKVQAYFGKWTGGTTLTLYADVKFTTTGTVALVADGTKNAYLDLNGYTITFSTNTSNLALDIHTGTLYVYSSTAGGKLYAPNAKWFTRSNSGGTGIFGERNSNSTQYGQNLTVETTLFNTALYGSGIGIYGGTYIQTANSQHNHFITVSRENEGAQSQFKNIRNATFILNKPNSFAIHWFHAGFQTIANCTFISNAPGTRVFGNASTNNSVPNSAPILANCDFVNILPVADLGNGKIPTYQNCRFSLNAASTDGFTVPAGDATELRYLARIAATDAITVGEDSYPVNYALVGAGEFLTVEWTDGTHPYWALGSAPVSDTAFGDIVEKQTDGTYTVLCDRYQRPTGITEVAAEHLGTTVSELTTDAGRMMAIAFSYQVDGGAVQYAPLLDTPAANGEQFVSLLNNLSNVKIVMYTDIELASGVLFGTFQDTVDAKNNPIKKILTSGDVDWDLNGFTVTVAENATPLSMANWSESEGAKKFNVLHFVSNATFKLYSSVPGGKYINNSSASIFGALKYVGNVGSYILGTDDLTEDGGDNLTVVSDGMIVIGYENNASGPAGAIVGINGGTYVYNGGIAAFNCGGKISVSNANILTTGAAKSVFISAFWAGQQGFSIDNSTVVAASYATLLVEEGHTDGTSTSGCKVQHTVTIKDTIFAGGNLEAGYANGACTFVFAGDVKAPNTADLAQVYAEVPTGKTAAYFSVSVYGTLAKFVGYYENPTTVTVNNSVNATTELWLVGSTYVTPSIDPAANVVIVDGVYYYRPAPIWTATVDGEVVENICAAENVGKTVILTVGGETYRILFSATVSGIITYYYDAETAGDDFKALLTPSGAYTYEIKLYNDVEAPATTIGKEGTRATYKIDANGYTLRFKKTTTAKASYILHSNSIVYWYSTEPGGAFDFGECMQMACCDKSGYGYFGEPVNDGSTTYGKNVTFYFDALHGYMYSTGLSFIGGTYIQVENPLATAMFDGRNTSYPTVIRNCTFIFKKVDVALFWGASFGNSGKVVNCSFICENPTDLFLPAGDKDKATTFENCNFYNVIANALGVAVNYNNCSFSLASLDAQTGGYIAYTGNPVTKEIAGKTYTFGAALLAADAVAKIEWIYAEPEYWALGAEASHASVVVDRFFAYGFNTFTVAGENEVVATLISIKSETLKMGLKLQNQIGMQLFFTNALAELGTEVKVKIGGTEYKLSELEAVDGFYRLSASVAPNIAYQAIPVSIVIGEREHTVNLSVGSYATKVLATASYSAVLHNVTYAMVEYVRAFAALNGEEFLPELKAPAGYGDPQTPGEAVSNNEDKTLLSEISFHFAESIELALKGTADAEGMTVKLTLANGHYAYAKVEGGVVLFNNLYVNDFAGEMTIEIGTETYTYSVENYYNAMTGENEVYKGAIAALYNYAYHADLYVSNLENAN